MDTVSYYQASIVVIIFHVNYVWQRTITMILTPYCAIIRRRRYVAATSL